MAPSRPFARNDGYHGRSGHGSCHVRTVASGVHRQRAANAVRFQRWATELNRQREAQGERPLSMDALRLVLRERQVNDGTDYEGLLEFQ